MRGVMVFVVGLVLGAVLFHLYYRSLAPATRCRWDHPFDRPAIIACTARAEAKGYVRRAREEMDALINSVGG